MVRASGSDNAKFKLIGFIVFVYERPKSPGGRRSVAYSTHKTLLKWRIVKYKFILLLIYIIEFNTIVNHSMYETSKFKKKLKWFSDKHKLHAVSLNMAKLLTSCLYKSYSFVMETMHGTQR